MRDEGFNILLSKFSRDARREIKWHENRALKVKLRHALNQRIYRVLKTIFLCLALAGVVVGIYFGRDLGHLAGEMSVTLPDSTLRPLPKPSLEAQRKLAEWRKQREAELEEIEK